MPLPTLVTFIVYFILLLGIGFYFYRKSVSIEDYLLGGRCMGAWVTALSAQASDMSGWLLMGSQERFTWQAYQIFGYP